jgi:adenine-specific DNA-methyltransferase
MNLTIFNQLDFLPALKAFFAELQVPINAVTDKPIAAKEILTSTYRDRKPFDLIDDVYFLGMVDDAAFRGNDGIDLVAARGLERDYDGLMIFGVALLDDGKLPTRSHLAEISRAFNREFCYTPVVVVFKYGGGAREYLAFANTERSQYKQQWREGEKAGKVTLLRDIDIWQPHSGHERILADLRIPMVGKDRVDGFAKLYAYWRKVLDVSLLNKEFYKEVSNWYFDACKKVIFPKDAKGNQESLIRLITRLMFVWFLKEKGLVPADLFKESEVRQILRSLEPQESSYYKAILQNLFFATLNTEWGERRFRKRSPLTPLSQGGKRDRGYMIHNEFRYGDLFVNAENALQTYFDQIPFLNGGLFECLDRRDKQDEPEIRIDGFSDRADNVLSIPNELFFGEEREVDLNADFGTSRKKYRVRGLIDIFNGYKFTVTENTPLEEEVALDPELLGQVFENLLAAYNPETQTTARKQTGSFYTPREIVNYMVDESLIAYLKNQLLVENVVFLEVGRRQTDIFGNEFKAGQLTIQEQLNQNPFKDKEDELEQKLRDLFAFDEVNPFADDEAIQKRLIAALDGCKILDPACGSGAFPMGVLQKMVFVLRKLDPQNKRWKEQQREKAIAPLLLDIQIAEKISYEAAKERAIAELREELQKIEDSFKNEMDYPRKLFLIQNCIFGVDIQPIAVQIAKLRFFISLIIEQKEDHDAENRGILPLPNLETKFVAANTLIGIEKSQQLSIFDTQEIQAKQGRLERLRREHFFARTLATKRKKRDEDELLCREIGEILQRNKFSNVELLQNWKPYDQNASASFFDPEWMFGVKDFDICIGNPPYVRQESIKEFKPIFQKQFTCYTGVADLYVYFYERAYNLLKPQGVLTYISSNKYFRSGYGEKLRGFLATKTKILQLIDFGDADIFTAIAYPSIIITTKASPTDHQVNSLTWDAAQPITEFPEVFKNNAFTIPQAEFKADGWRLESSKVLDLLAKLRKAGTPLGEYVNGKFYYGIKTGFNEAFVIDRDTRDRLIAEHPSSAEVIKPLLRGRDVKRWTLDYQDLYLIFTRRGIDIKKYPAIESYLSQFKDRLMPGTGRKAGTYKWYEIQDNIAYWQEFDETKIVWGNLATSPQFSIEDKGMYICAPANLIVAEDYKYLMAILNSPITQYIVSQNAAVRQGGFLEFKPMYVSQIPIPTAGEGDRVAIEKLVSYVLYLTEQLKNIPSHIATLDQSVTDKRMNLYFEQIIDALVMELYLPEELHEHDKYFMRYLLPENLPSLDTIKGDKMQILRQIFERLFDKEHPIRHNLFLLNTIPVVRIIEGKS